MKITLRLCYRSSPQRAAVAWLLPGGDPQQWLAELTCWDIPLAGTMLTPLPSPEQPDKILGAIVVLGNSKQPIRPARALPYGWMSDRVLAPVEAACDPPVTEEELNRLLPSPAAQFIWHPSGGLIQLHRGNAFSVAALLAAPLRAERNWNAAQAGIAIQQRLLSIQPSVQPTMEQVVSAGRDDIGSQPLAGGKLPQSPGEPRGGVVGRALRRAGLKGASLAAGAVAAAAGALATAAGAIVAGCAMLAGGLAGGLAAGAIAAEAGALAAGAAGLAGAMAGGFVFKMAGRKSGRQPPAKKKPAGDSWFGKLAEWARQRRQAAEKNLEFLRNRQIERLLSLLQTAPDVGLRFALPMAGSHRGLAQPDWRLAERDVDFNMGALGGGGRASDVWSLPPELLHRLLSEYRELANREMALGRHRRAAYIFGQLLGDLNAAAAALKGGGHYREAAILYEQRLHQPLTAAQCLEQGGLAAEAIALYERLEQWEKAGDLYRQIDQADDAERAYRTAAQGFLTRQNFLEAARLFEFKLTASDEAYQALLAGWPASAAARKCVDASFELLARHQRHSEAELRVGELHAVHRSDVPGQELAAALAHVAGSYPHDSVRTAAAETTRSLISGRLPVATVKETESLLASLASLVPADRLLAQDCQRFQSKHIEEQAAARPRPIKRAALRVSSWFRLPPAEWQTAVSIGEEFYAAGWIKDHLLVVRGRWDGSVQLPAAEPWRVPAELREYPILFAADSRGLSPLFIHLAGARYSLKPAEFRASDKFPRHLSIRPHLGCSEETVLIQYGFGVTVLTGKLAPAGNSGAALTIVPYQGEALLPGIRSLQLPESDYGAGLVQLPSFARGDDLFFGYDRFLVSSSDGSSREMPSVIRSITGSPPHASPRIVVGCERGGAVLWGKSANAPCTPLVPHLVEPAIGINRGGWIAVATAETVQFYGTHDGKLTFVGELAGPKAKPIAVLTTDQVGRIAVVTDTGTVLVYELAD